MRHHEAGDRTPTLVRQQTVAETWAEIRQYSRPVSVGTHSYLPDGRRLIGVFAGGLESGSFKERGAITKMLKLRAEGHREATLFSAGNHLLGAALGARALGFKVHGFVPWYAPQIKIDKSVALGEGNVTVTRVAGGLEEARQATLEHAHANKKHIIPIMEPYDDADVARGQGTVLYELLRRNPDIQHVVLPEGGGGLHAGSMQVVRELGLNAVIHGVKLSERQELCEGAFVHQLGDVALRMRQENPTLWGETLTVDPEDVGAMVALEDAVSLEHSEAMGAAAFYECPEATSLLAPAAAHRFASTLDGNVAVVMTGSNADQSKLRILHDLHSAGIESSLQPGFHMASGYQLRRAA
jgi:threonine dehydratase